MQLPLHLILQTNCRKAQEIVQAALLFEDFLFENSLTHIGKMVQNYNFLVKNPTFYRQIQELPSKMTERIYRE
jgi:hypothetical protein